MLEEMDAANDGADDAACKTCVAGQLPVVVFTVEDFFVGPHTHTPNGISFEECDHHHTHIIIIMSAPLSIYSST